MFFTMTAAIGGGMMAAIWLLEDGPAVAAAAGAMAGAASAVMAAALLARLDRRIDPATDAGRASDDLPRLPHRRRAALRGFARHREPAVEILASPR